MTDYDKLIKHLSSLATEQINPDTLDIDRLQALEIVRKINSEDEKVAGIVKRALPQISAVAETFAATLKQGGRVFYIGAGTSGRLGVLDAAECPPTFGTDPNKIIGLISGGHATLVLSKEGAEDDYKAAINDLQHHQLTKKDMVIGLAASVRTPYTLAGLEHALNLGAATACIICNDRTDFPLDVDVVIPLPVGPEVITGSTRMKSATAQKMTLNMISTTAMILLGKTCGNLMVDLQARSEKLAARSRKILMDLLEIDLDLADDLLAHADGSVKIAIVMYNLNCDKAEAQIRLEKADGFITKCLSER
ncbi:MAG: N-acetylmuramic acid 6-phosphate etherase [candidate division Zixibacteria bacterium]|nr:N-acetylmuramic acid 6-phosphate etherase [candidate division Zixibacteria bacterium]